VVEEGSTHDGLPQLCRHWHVEHPDAVVLIVHGINEHSGRYEHVGVRMAVANLAVVGYDHRGFGGSGGGRAYVDSFDEYLDDLEDQMARVAELGVPIVLLGHSLGGLIALAYVLHREPRPDALVLSAPALGDRVLRWMRLLARPASVLVPRLRLASPWGNEVLSRDPAVWAAFDADPLNEQKTSVRLGRELIKAQAATRADIDHLDVPTLVLHGGSDELVPSEASEILDGLSCVERRVLEGLRHEPFNEPEGLNIVDDVVDWIRQKLCR